MPSSPTDRKAAMRRMSQGKPSLDEEKKAAGELMELFGGALGPAIAGFAIGDPLINIDAFGRAGKMIERIRQANQPQAPAESVPLPLPGGDQTVDAGAQGGPGGFNVSPNPVIAALDATSPQLRDIRTREGVEDLAAAMIGGGGGGGVGAGAAGGIKVFGNKAARLSPRGKAFHKGKRKSASFEATERVSLSDRRRARALAAEKPGFWKRVFGRAPKMRPDGLPAPPKKVSSIKEIRAYEDQLLAAGADPKVISKHIDTAIDRFRSGTPKNVHRWLEAAAEKTPSPLDPGRRLPPPSAGGRALAAPQAKSGSKELQVQREYTAKAEVLPPEGQGFDAVASTPSKGLQGKGVFIDSIPDDLKKASEKVASSGGEAIRRLEKALIEDGVPENLVRPSIASALRRLKDGVETEIVAFPIREALTAAKRFRHGKLGGFAKNEADELVTIGGQAANKVLRDLIPGDSNLSVNMQGMLNRFARENGLDPRIKDKVVVEEWIDDLVFKRTGRRMPVEKLERLSQDASMDELREILISEMVKWGKGQMSGKGGAGLAGTGPTTRAFSFKGASPEPSRGAKLRQGFESFKEWHKKADSKQGHLGGGVFGGKVRGRGMALPTKDVDELFKAANPAGLSSSRGHATFLKLVDKRGDRYFLNSRGEEWIRSALGEEQLKGLKAAARKVESSARKAHQKYVSEMSKYEARKKALDKRMDELEKSPGGGSAEEWDKVYRVDLGLPSTADIARDLPFEAREFFWQLVRGKK